MNRKNVSGVSVVGTSSDVMMRRNPMMIPITINKQDSGKMDGSFGVMWKPGKERGREKGRNNNIEQCNTCIHAQSEFANWP